jgi:DNA-binding response OmpR family regulator
VRLAILEDDPELGPVIQRWLEEAGHSCRLYEYGKALQRDAGRESFDLMLFDWQLPDLSGDQLLRWFREQLGSTIPVLFVTNRDAEEDIVTALQAGADDYMVKPVRRLELLARVEALLRRSRPRPVETARIESSPFVIDTNERTVQVNGARVELTDKEYELVVFLFRNLGRLISRGHMLESVWGRNPEVISRTIDTHVSRVRSKLGLRPENGFRLTPVYNYGYRLERIGTRPEPQA